MSSAAFKLVSTILSIVQTLLAFGIAAISIWYFIELKGFLDMRNRDRYIVDFTVHWPQIAPWMFLFVCFVVICVSACGVYSACAKKKTALYVYVCFLTVATVAALVAGVLGLTCGNTEESDEFISRTVSDAYTQMTVRKDVEIAFGDIERRYRCCGIKGSSDYTQQSIPRSCCDSEERGDCRIAADRRLGCASIAVPYSQQYFKLASIGTIVMALLSLGSVVVAILSIVSSKRRANNYKSEAEEEPLKLPL